MFKKILIANRGEIACRVIRTARRMGIKTVAVYSEADKRRAPRRAGRRSGPDRPAAVAQSYLADRPHHQGVQGHRRGGRASRATASSRRTPRSARALEEAGIVFIGPKAHAIEAMGDKIASKKLAIEAKVSTIPGHNEAVTSTRTRLSKIARRIGYPVMIKASAGGGGKGLRIAHDDTRVRARASPRAATRRRARFGDDRVFIEKFIEEPRHIEIQVLGDAHGNCVYLRERECSIQRRHQKVIEEAPSPFHRRSDAPGDGRAGGGARPRGRVPVRRDGRVRRRQRPATSTSSR